MTDAHQRQRGETVPLRSPANRELKMDQEEDSGDDLLDYVKGLLQRGSATRSSDLADFELVDTPDLNPEELQRASRELRSMTPSRSELTPCASGPPARTSSLPGATPRQILTPLKSQDSPTSKPSNDSPPVSSVATAEPVMLCWTLLLREQEEQATEPESLPPSPPPPSGCSSTG